MTFIIERGIPVPPRAVNGRPFGRMGQLFLQLREGDSVEFNTLKEALKLRAWLVTRQKKNEHLEWKIVTRKTSDGKTRAWKVKV